MKIKIRNPKDFWSGLIFLTVGALAAGIAYFSYPMGNASRMGPGYFPFVLASILAILGLAIISESLVTEGEPVGRFAVRPLFWILAATVAFGLLATTLGITLAIVVLVVGSSYGGHEFKLGEVLITSAVLAITSVLIFVYGLKLPFPICPDLAVLQQFALCRG
jgi:hypothetical protein